MKMSKKYFLSREASWLEFNARVLDEAGDIKNPLIERLKFIAIFSSNLDEFFMVRVAGLRQLVKMGDATPDPAGVTPAVQLEAIRSRVMGLVKRQYRYLQQDILPKLENHGILIRRCAELDAAQKVEIENVFRKQIFPVLTPMAVDPSHPFPILNNGSIEIAVRLNEAEHGKTVYAFVEVPEVLPRFIRVNTKDAKSVYVLLEDVIMEHIQALFKGCRVREFFPFRITRDMDFELEEEGVSDLLKHMEKELKQRKSREPIRLEIPVNCRGKLAKWLQHQFSLINDFKYSVPGPMHLAQFFEFVAKESRPELLEKPYPPLPLPEFSGDESIFEAIKREGAIMMTVPFQSFDPVVRLIEAAAADPDVLAIKQTLYRVSGNSPIVSALQKAAENGKQVTVIVELKARFDEGNNIIWARRLEASGAHVIYGIAGLKIHCKSLLIIRRENGIIRRYVHLGTGNYNDKTAKLYTDIGLFLDDPLICEEISTLFNGMTGYSSLKEDWRKISVAPFSLREKFLFLIDREARLATQGAPGRIIAKMNSLVDPEIILHLHEAAEAGVKIDLIVRGICCLKPGKNSGNINVISIVDRFLEHSRIYYFANAGEPEYFLSSADWMPRNLDARIEVLFPVEKESLRENIDKILQIQLKDKRKARKLLPDGRYTRTFRSNHESTRSQALTYQMFKAVSEPETHEISGELKIFKNPEEVGKH